METIDHENSATTSNDDPWLIGLNTAQREAVCHVNGPMLVVAGAGSGKTRVLTRRIAHLLNDVGAGGHPHARPQEVLAITFTNKAALEMRERVRELVGERAERMWVMTFHAACARFLREEAKHLGFNSNFTIYDQGDQVRLVKQCLEQLERDPKQFAPASVHHAISNAKNQLIGPDEYRSNVLSFHEETVAEVFALYDRKLRESNAMDFDDMIRYTVDLLENNKEVQERWQRRFRYIMVDEYQDTNHAQYRMLKVLAAQHSNVMCVGDADQSIYSWRGADIRNITSFEQDFPNPKIVVLDINYRSTSHILEAANAVVRNNIERLDKELKSHLGYGEKVKVVQVEDEHAEARYVLNQIDAAIDTGSSLKDIAIFYRTNAQSRVLEDLLTRSGHAYQVIGGPRFYERAEIKDVFAYLNALVNPSDSLSLARIINVPKRGIGETTIAKLRAYAETYGESLEEALRQAAMEGSFNAGTLRRLELFQELLEGLRNFANENSSVATIIEEVYERSGIVSALQSEDTIEAQGRLENLGELVNVAREFDSNNDEATLSDFLQALALQAQGDALDTEGGVLTLMTIHNAKGLEYPIVFLTGMEEGLFPHSRSIQDGDVEEERRLAYVGITRAMQQLTLVHAGSRSVFGRRQYSMPSRFLKELPDEHVDTVQLAGSNTWGGASAFGRSGGSGSGWGAKSDWGSSGDWRSSGGEWSSSGSSESNAIGSRGWKQSSGNKRRSSDEFGATFGASSSRKKSDGWGSTDGSTPTGASGLLFGSSGGSSAKRQPKKQGTISISAGDNVLHQSFGEGVVLNVEGDLAVIRFNDGQERRLMLAYAPLTKL